MKKNVAADTSFYVCTACNIKQTDVLLHYLNNYQFHAGKIILDEELPDMGKNNDAIREKISRNNANYTELFKALSKRKDKHIENDGEYEAIGIAIELSLTNSLHCLILDDNSPKKFAKNIIAAKFPELIGKVHGTMGFMEMSCLEDKLIKKEEVICNLKKMYQSYIDFEKSGKKEHRPCSMDEKLVNTVLLPLIQKLENTHE